MTGREAFLAECAIAYNAMDPVATKASNFIELAKKALAESLRLGRMLLRERLETDPRAKAEDGLVCQACGNPMRIQKPEQHRRIQTILGWVDYHRAYTVCDRCGMTCVPLDEGLGIPETGPSIDALHKMCHAAVSTRSFEDAAEVLQVQAGIEISRKHVRCLAEKEGKALVNTREEEVRKYQSHQPPTVSDDVPELLVIAADGGRVQTRQVDKDDRWKENKIGVIYDAQPRPQTDVEPDHYEGAEAQTKTYVATMEPWEAMGWMLRVEAEKRGYNKAKQRLFLGDGARSIREMKNLQFPESIFILDWAHATEHLNQSAKAAFGEGTTQAKAWYEMYKNFLWDGKVAEIIRELDNLSRHVGLPTPTDPESSPRVILDRNAHSYFPNNKEAMNYPLFRSKGWPIGSGVVEGAVKQFAIRLKGSEKFWNVSNTGAEEMLALCALYHSEDGRWERYWNSRAQPYQRKQAPP